MGPFDRLTDRHTTYPRHSLSREFIQSALRTALATEVKTPTTQRLVCLAMQPLGFVRYRDLQRAIYWASAFLNHTPRSRLFADAPRGHASGRFWSDQQFGTGNWIQRGFVERNQDGAYRVLRVPRR